MIFLEFFYNILPLYGLILLGFIAGRRLGVDQKALSQLLIYCVMPIALFFFVARMEFDPGVIVLFVKVFCFSLLLGALVLRITRLYLSNKLALMLAAMGGNNNWGYFGLPVALVFFDAQTLAVYVLIGFSSSLYLSSAGIYYLSRGEMTSLQSIGNMFRFPLVYGILAGLFWSYFALPLPNVLLEVHVWFKGALTVMGMMLVGLGLAQVKQLKGGGLFLANVLALRFIVWPVCALAAIYFGLVAAPYQAPLLLFSVMPVAANMVAFANQFNVSRSKVSFSILVSTLVTLLAIPLMMQYAMSL